MFPNSYKFKIAFHLIGCARLHYFLSYKAYNWENVHCAQKCAIHNSERIVKVKVKLSCSCWPWDSSVHLRQPRGGHEARAGRVPVVLVILQCTAIPLLQTPKVQCFHILSPNSLGKSSQFHLAKLTSALLVKHAPTIRMFPLQR